MAERPDVVILDDMTWPPEANGVGALLMTDPSPPRDEFGHPYQPRFRFDEQSRPTGLVGDHDHVLAWVNKGSPGVDIDPRGQRVPETVERAARDW